MKIINQIKRTFEKNKLDFVIFFVTTKCNSKCKHCFFWKSLNQKNEFDINRIKKIFSKIGQIRDVSLSGGEPILRNDIVDIADIIYKESKIQSLSIPSNGLLPERLCEISEKILQKCPKIKLLINLSIDGPKEIHEYIRGVKGNFKKVINSAKLLQKLRKRYPQLYININTVICNKNIDELPKLIDYIKKNLDVDGHYFEVMRGFPKESYMATPNINKLKNFYSIALKTSQYYFDKKFKNNRIHLNLGKNITNMFHLGITKTLYNIQINSLKSKKWPTKCLAGKTSVVIYPEGEVSVCEMMKSFANLKDYDYNIHKILKSKKAREIFRKINRQESPCPCTHNCFIYNTINHSPFIRFFHIPLNYIKWKLV